MALTQREKGRIRHYYFGTSYLSALFCSLRGGRRTAQESLLFFDLSALASFFDDLVDKHRAHFKAQGSLLPQKPIVFANLADERKLALHFYKKILQSIPADNLSMFQEYLQRLFLVELAGQENDIETNLHTIKKITAEKGACAVLVFRCLMKPLPAAAEAKAWSEFGHLIQLSDDIFDLWFDREKNVATLATLLSESNGVGNLELLFETQLSCTKSAFLAIPVSNWRIRRTLAGIQALTAITRTCLSRYKQLEKRHGKLPLDNRQKMVVDMAKWSNKLLALHYLVLDR